MRWIQWHHQFLRISIPSSAIIKNVPNFANYKFSHPRTPFSGIECPVRSVFRPIRRAESNGTIFFLPYRLWFSRYSGNQVQFCDFPISLKSTAAEAPPTVRTPWKNVDGPTWRAESNGIVRFIIAVLVVEISHKTNKTTNGMESYV